VSNVVPFRRPGGVPVPLAPAPAEVVALPGAAPAPVAQPRVVRPVHAKKRTGRDGHHPDCPPVSDRRLPERCPVCRGLALGAPGDGVRREVTSASRSA
jgi:hypothetical protein